MMKILLPFCIVGIFLLRKGCPTLDACNWSFQKLGLKIWTSRKPKYQTSHHLAKFESREELQPIKMLTELTVL